jgi:hypothetical protein
MIDATHLTAHRTAASLLKKDASKIGGESTPVTIVGPHRLLGNLHRPRSFQRLPDKRR